MKPIRIAEKTIRNLKGISQNIEKLIQQNQIRQTPRVFFIFSLPQSINPRLFFTVITFAHNIVSTDRLKPQPDLTSENPIKSGVGLYLNILWD
ncbi:unnamed protein product [Lactuca virosa]|uniref:Uncharacterized protein n=1 Tax=Lactuca virosa TaxID=75947 RepID=A0AAU9MUK4_9ASTR|nr:unnamed protein product [Lactuca virosa]